MFTRTYTRYFAERDLTALDDCVKRLVEDGESRMPYMDEDARHNMMTRLSLLKSARSFLNERAG
jgi:hypothetical protein